MSRRRFITILAVMMIVVVGVSLSGILPFNKLARTISRPATSYLSSLGQALGSKLAELGQLGSLREANQRLARDNLGLTQELVRAKELDRENQQLRQSLNFAQTRGYKVLGADVVGYQADGIRKLIAINQGSVVGVKAGQAVLAGDHLVGVVQKVEADTSVIELLNDGAFRALGLTHKQQAPGIIKGQGNGITMEKIPRDLSVEVGELVLTDSRDGSLPAGILLGGIADLTPSSDGLFQTAQIKTLVDLGRLRSVVVIVGQR